MKLRPILVCLAVYIILAGAGQAFAQQGERVINVFVPLCDNIHQRIFPVKPSLGRGDDPDGNLYWGELYGVRNYFSRQNDWALLEKQKNPSEIVKERLVFQHNATGVYLVAEAYLGSAIKQCTLDFLDAVAGKNYLEVKCGGKALRAGSGAGLLIFAGHNGLMDFTLPREPTAADKEKRAVAVFACQSRKYFENTLKEAGAGPLLLTTGNMAPEAYIIHALAGSWASGKRMAETQEQVAQAYDRYQKCGLKGARALFYIAP